MDKLFHLQLLSILKIILLTHQIHGVYYGLKHYKRRLLLIKNLHLLIVVNNRYKYYLLHNYQQLPFL